MALEQGSVTGRSSANTGPGHAPGGETGSQPWCSGVQGTSPQLRALLPDLKAGGSCEVCGMFLVQQAATITRAVCRRALSPGGSGQHVAPAHTITKSWGSLGAERAGAVGAGGPSSPPWF